MEDQPLPADASPIALSPGYVVDSDPEEDEEDPKEDPANYPVDRGDNDDDESSNDDDGDDDVEKDEEDEEEEHLASVDPSDVSTDDHETMTTINQGMSVEEIKRVVAQRVANAIEEIDIYETKTNMALKSMSQTERKEEKVAKNASNKRKWEGNHNGSSSQQNKGHKVHRAHTAWSINKKAYAGSLPLCNQCTFHHNGSCTVKCENCKKVGHIIQNYRTPATAKNQRTRTCYECGSLRHYKSECPIVKFQKCMDMIHGGVRATKPKIMQDSIEIETKLMNKKISTLVVCQAKNKRKTYTVWYGEKKYYSGSKPLCSKCNYHHDGPCAPKCHKCNRVGHLARDCRSSTNANTTNIQKGTGASQKATCYECGNQGHYRRDCPERKNQNHENQIESMKACGVVHAFEGGETEQDLNNIKDEIEA
nr:reverse transcriptase domain-containing protein [Tanacetum cinerariifolium]